MGVEVHCPHCGRGRGDEHAAAHSRPTTWGEVLIVLGAFLAMLAAAALSWHA